MSTATETNSKDFMTAWINALKAIEKKYSSADEDITSPLLTDAFEDYVPEGFYDKDLEEISAMSDESVQLELEDYGYSDKAVTKNINALTSKNVFIFRDKHKKVDSTLILQSTLMSELIRESIGKSFIYSSRQEETLALLHSDHVRNEVVEANKPKGSLLPFPGLSKSSMRGEKSPRTQKRKLYCGIAASLAILTLSTSIGYKDILQNKSQESATTTVNIAQTDIDAETPTSFTFSEKDPLIANAIDIQSKTDIFQAEADNSKAHSATVAVITHKDPVTYGRQNDATLRAEGTPVINAPKEPIKFAQVDPSDNSSLHFARYSSNHSTSTSASTTEGSLMYVSSQRRNPATLNTTVKAEPGTFAVQIFAKGKKPLEPSDSPAKIDELIWEIGLKEHGLTTNQRLNILDKVKDVLETKREQLIEAGHQYNDMNLCSQTNLHKHYVTKGDTLYEVINSCGYNIEDPKILTLNNKLNINDILIIRFDASKVVNKVDIERVGSDTIKLYPAPK